EVLDRGGLVMFAALEVDDTIALLVTATLPAHRDPPEIVASRGALLAFRQGLDGRALVQPGTIDQHQLALRVGHRFVGFECHCRFPKAPSSRRSGNPRRGLRWLFSLRSSETACRERPSSCPWCGPF